MKALARLRRRREQTHKPTKDATQPHTQPSTLSIPSPITPQSPPTSPHPTHSSTQPTDPTHPTPHTDDSSSPQPAPATTQHAAGLLDGKGQLTFNLQLLTDQGIVICPGFHRDHQAFTSTDLLAAVRPNSATSQQQSAALPALRAKADVETAYSPTLLPSVPGARGEEGHTSAQSSSSAASSMLDELTISYAKGAFSLIDPPASAATAAASQSSSTLDASSSFLTTASHSTTAAATAALRRLALTSWRSSNNSAPSVSGGGAGGETENAAFPPTSALPPAQSAEEETGGGLDEDEEEAVAGLHSSSTHPAAVSTSARTPAADTTGNASSKAGSVDERAVDSSYAVSPSVISAQNAATSSPASDTTATAHSVTSSFPVTTSLFSPFSLPAALLSSVSSWLFPPAAPTQQPTNISTLSPAPSPPPTPPPPPPPPPYATTLRRVVVIGVHGWSLFGGMLGDKPLLVSSRFCYYIQHALQRYMRSLSLPDGSTRPPLHITCIPLYGHGRVEDRVSMYVESQLPQYTDELRQADHVIIACHSQGCMVTSSLLALLLLNPNPPLTLPAPPHISILMLAGLHHGPFPDLPTDLYPPTKELLSYSHFHSSHSQLHIERMQRLLAAGVRVMLVGSVHDAVVPLYSSLGQLLGRSTNLVRAMYVDYQHYQPDFLYSLLSLTLYLSNNPPALTQPPGLAPGSDVLTHLSGFLRGSLLEKAGGAHSAMHRLVDVYGLAVEWALSGAGEVASDVVGGGSVVVAGGYSGVMWNAHLTDGFTLSKLNRHLLVWSVRGMLAELESRRGESGLDVDGERQRLMALYVEWAPKSKNLRALRETLAVVFDNNRTTCTNIQSNL